VAGESEAPIAPLDDLVFTGWDIFGGLLQ